ncbi:MAG: DUF5005 domain-containing protein [Candidatus Symbiothrix sp.]|jgi:hypothetical protein|nr:DUF5005 domain-containing protein [Candidatus Symbiothrix sp.]
MNKKTFFLLLMAGLLFFAGNAQNHTVPGIELEFVPNDGSHYPNLSNNKWDNKVSVYKDLTYNSFYRRSLGWNGGDGIYSTLLPDGNVFWSFADSFFGALEPNRVRNGGKSNLPRNGAFIQTDESFDGFVCLNELVQTKYSYMSTYYKGKTWLRHPEGEKTLEQINVGEVDSDMIYWPGDATVYHGETGDTLQLLWGQISEGMVRSETAYTEYTLEGQLGDEGYMKLVKYERYFQPYTTNYGSGIFEDEDGHTYLYGNHDFYPVVARTETRDLKSKWTYYIKGTDNQWSWVPGETEEEIDYIKSRMTASKISNGWIGQPNMFKYLDKYYLIGQEALGPQVWMWQGDTPWGPFTNSKRKMIYVTGAITPKDKPNEPAVTYNTFLHVQMSKKGELCFSYNPNPVDFADNFNAEGSADLYTPFFVRIFDWHLLWNVPNPDPTAIHTKEIDEMLSVYPNPATDVLKISSATESPFRWKLSNLIGACLQSGQSTSGETNIAVSNYVPGVYLLQVETQSGTQLHKFIKK